MCVCVHIIDTFLFSLSLSHAGLQLYPGRHGDPAQHWSGYFVYPLFYLKTALLSESAYLCYNNYKFMSITTNPLPLRGPGESTATGCGRTGPGEGSTTILAKGG